MITFTITIAPDEEMRNEFCELLTAHQITFDERTFTRLRESEKDTSDILGFVFSFGTSAELGTSLTAFAIVATAYFKYGHAIEFKDGERQLKLRSAKDVDRAIALSNALSQTKRRSPRKRK